MISPLLTKLAEEVEEKEEEGMSPEEKKKHEASETPEEEAAEEAAEGEAPAPAAAPVNTAAIMDFFAQPGQVDDAMFHKFCEQNGFDVHQAEGVAYALAQKCMQLLREGKSQEKQLDPNTVDPQQLEWGIMIEQEHTSDPALQKKIALDHLAENPQYYSEPYMQEELQREYGQGGEGQEAQEEQPQPNEKVARLVKKIKSCKKSSMSKKAFAIRKRAR